MNNEAKTAFCCNLKAFDSAERAHHRKLTDKLMAARMRTTETAEGYEFQFRPADTTLTELAVWAAAESKCCPFFDFHLHAEEGGTVLRLRLTGDPGVKPFIRAEFHLD